MRAAFSEEEEKKWNGGREESPNPPEDEPPGEKQPRRPYPISGREIGLIVLLTLVILLVGTLLASALGVLSMGEEAMDIDEEMVGEWASGNLESLPLSMKLMAMLIQLLIVVPALVMVSRKRLSVPVFFRLRPVPLEMIGLSLLIGLGVTVVGDEIGRLVNLVLPLPEEMAAGIQRMLKLNSWADLLTMGLTVAIIAPLAEEMLFRGFFQRYFEANRGVTTGVLLTSGLFAAYHFNLYWLIPILLMATVMGALAWRAESIVPTFIVHATNNTSGLAVANLYESDPSWYVMGGHVAPWVLLVALGVMVWALRRFFVVADQLGMGGHGPSGGVGRHVNRSV